MSADHPSRRSCERTSPESADSEPKRRQLLQSLAGGAAAASIGLSGCVQDADETEDQTGDDASDGDSSTAEELDTVSVGVLVPESGPSGPLGQAQRRGAELGVQFVNDSDDFGFEIDPIYEDTQTDPPTGRNRAERVVEDEGVDYILGGLESSVSLAISEYVSGRDTIYMSGAAAIEITGEDCNENTFRYETNAAQQMAGLTGFAARELGTNWWLHSTDEAYGVSAFEQIKRRIEAEELDVDIVGETMPDFGTEDYGPQISQISNSEADVLVVPETGGDLINFINQASNAGLTDEVAVIGTALFAQVSREALGQTAVGTYSSTLYNHQLETGDNEQFVEAYADEFEGRPGNFARVGYELVRTTARGIQAAGTDDIEQFRETLPELEMETVLGETAYRSCDHQAVNPVWTGEIVADGEETEIELLGEVSGEDAIRPCEETGCSL